MITIWQTIFLALLQGVTELFPISSTGHTVIIPGLLGWSTLLSSATFLPIIVALHIGTSIALLAYFWRDWLQIVRTLIKNIKEGEVHTGTVEWESWLIIIGVIPAGLIGLILEKPLKAVFSIPIIAAAFLVVNGSVLFAGERMRRRSEEKLHFVNAKEREASFRPLSSLTWKEAIIVGLAQSLALIPGFSRSGVSMVAGLGVKLNHEDAARYSFLLGTPLIFAAGALEIPQLTGVSTQTWVFVAVGMVITGVAAYLSTRFLMKYFETGRLYPFAYYCWAVGLIAIILFATVFQSRAA
ncbi:MAG TPA: undecaprenyl-diphosphate phosphatase [Ktedonobacteraceae bacterium]|nr:undecaprenyl-diphosphate phosphatase [Ktedonobacteraceae bacterium]